MEIDASAVVLDEDGEIRVNGEEVGYLGWSENVLVDISVDSEYRENGIATAAVEEMVQRIKNDGYEMITTTTVVNPAMEAVLQKVGFDERVEEVPIYEPEDIDADISEEDIPVEEKVVWEYQC